MNREDQELLIERVALDNPQLPPLLIQWTINRIDRIIRKDLNNPDYSLIDEEDFQLFEEQLKIYAELLNSSAVTRLHITSSQKIYNLGATLIKPVDDTNPLPFTVRLLLRCFLPERDRDEVMGDLAEEFAETHDSLGKHRAKVFIWSQTLGSVWAFFTRRIWMTTLGRLLEWYQQRRG